MSVNKPEKLINEAELVALDCCYSTTVVILCAKQQRHISVLLTNMQTADDLSYFSFFFLPENSVLDFMHIVSDLHEM